MALGAVLAEAEDRAARHNFAAVRQEVHDHLLQVEQRRLAVHEGDHVHAEALLHLRHLEEVVEHDLGHGALLEVDADADLLRGLVAHFGDALDLLLAHELVHLLVHDALVDHVRNLVDDDADAVAAEFLKMRAGAHDHAAAARAVALMDVGDAEDATCRKIGSGHQANEVLDRALGIAELVQAGVDRLAEIVRRDVRGHAHGDAGGAVDEKLRQTGRQDDGLPFGVVEVRNEVDRVLVDVGEHFTGDLLKAHFRVTHGGGAVAVDRAEVALTEDERIAQREGLGHAHDRHVGGGVAVRVVLAEHFTHNARGLLGRVVVGVFDLVHGMKNAAVHRLQAVAHIGKRAAHDHAHGVVEIRALHFRFKRNRKELVRDAQGGSLKRGVVFRILGGFRALHLRLFLIVFFVHAVYSSG